MSSEAKEWVLQGGPWFISQRLLILKKWEPGHSAGNISLQKMPLWVKLCGVPMELFTKEGLSYVASATGTPLYMDKATKSRRRVHYARVCVKAGIEDDRSEFIPVDIGSVGQIMVHVEYPWRPFVCSICHQIGHKDREYVKTRKVWRPMVKAQIPVQTADAEAGAALSVSKEEETIIAPSIEHDTSSSGRNHISSTLITNSPTVQVPTTSGEVDQNPNDSPNVRSHSSNMQSPSAVRHAIVTIRKRVLHPDSQGTSESNSFYILSDEPRDNENIPTTRNKKISQKT